MGRTVPPGGIGHYTARTLHQILKGANPDWAREFSVEPLLDGESTVGHTFNYRTSAFNYALTFFDSLASSADRADISLWVHNSRDDSSRGIRPLYDLLIDAKAYEHKNPRWVGVRNRDSKVLDRNFGDMGVKLTLEDGIIDLTVRPHYLNNSQKRTQDADKLAGAVIRSVAKPVVALIPELPR